MQELHALPLCIAGPVIVYTEFLMEKHIGENFKTAEDEFGTGI
jgi:hypothetical protein